MPLPTWGSWITCTPFGVSRRARSASSGIDIESPVTSSVCRGRLGGALSVPIAAGSNASGVTTWVWPFTVVAVSELKPSRPLRLGFGDSQAVAALLTPASGS